MAKGLKGFQKGHKSFLTKEQYKKNGKKISETHKKNNHHPNLIAQKNSILGRKKWNESRYKNLNCNSCNKIFKRKFCRLNRGNHNFCSKKCAGVKTLILFAKGNKNPNYKGGVTPLNEQIRKSPDYKLWRTAVFKRDNFNCLNCGKSNTYLEANHIKKFADYPELRLNIDNGITLCKDCHNLTKGNEINLISYFQDIIKTYAGVNKVVLER